MVANKRPVSNQSRREYSVIQNLGPLRIHQERYAKLGSFGDREPNPAANNKPICNQSETEYSTNVNLGPL